MGWNPDDQPAERKARVGLLIDATGTLGHVNQGGEYAVGVGVGVWWQWVRGEGGVGQPACDVRGCGEGAEAVCGRALPIRLPAKQRPRHAATSPVPHKPRPPLTHSQTHTIINITHLKPRNTRP